MESRAPAAKKKQNPRNTPRPFRHPPDELPFADYSRLGSASPVQRIILAARESREQMRALIDFSPHPATIPTDQILLTLRLPASAGSGNTPSGMTLAALRHLIRSASASELRPRLFANFRHTPNSGNASA